MTASIADLAAAVRAGLDAEEQDARDAPDGQWWVEERDPRHWGDVRDAAVACSQGLVAELPDFQGGHLNAPHIARQDPAATLARVGRLRKLVDLIVAEEHRKDEDPHYTCPLLLWPHIPCNCGRDERVRAYLTLLLPETTEES